MREQGGERQGAKGEGWSDTREINIFFPPPSFGFVSFSEFPVHILFVHLRRRLNQVKEYERQDSSNFLYCLLLWTVALENTVF